MSYPCWWEGTAYTLTQTQKEELQVLNEYFSKLEKPVKQLRNCKPRKNPDRFNDFDDKTESSSLECLQTDYAPTDFIKPDSENQILERRISHSEAKIKNPTEYKLVFKGPKTPCTV